jgi:hypothetical protein
VVNNPFAHDIFETWDITPQPANETISLEFPALGAGNNFDAAGVFQVTVTTICTPTAVPEPHSLGLGICGAILTALGGTLRRVRNFGKRS